MGIGYAAQLGADAGLPLTDSVLTLNRTVLSRVAKVNSTDALIVLWAWHLVATPGRAKQAKVKSAKACHGASNDPPQGEPGGSSLALQPYLPGLGPLLSGNAGGQGAAWLAWPDPGWLRKTGPWTTGGSHQAGARQVSGGRFCRRKRVPFN